jgi:hypothetical protein
MLLHVLVGNGTSSTVSGGSNLGRLLFRCESCLQAFFHSPCIFHDLGSTLHNLATHLFSFLLRCEAMLTFDSTEQTREAVPPMLATRALGYPKPPQYSRYRRNA